MVSVFHHPIRRHALAAFYNKIDPTFAGIPFFYWSQLLWVLISAVFTAVVYLATDE